MGAVERICFWEWSFLHRAEQKRRLLRYAKDTLQFGQTLVGWGDDIECFQGMTPRGAAGQD
jgi:hypothetical protein